MQGAEIKPLHSSPANGERLHLKKKKNLLLFTFLLKATRVLGMYYLFSQKEEGKGQNKKKKCITYKCLSKYSRYAQEFSLQHCLQKIGKKLEARQMSINRSCVNYIII